MAISQGEYLMNVQAELQAHESNLKTAGGIEPFVTRKQVQGIVSLMRQVIPDRDERITVLRLIAGGAMMKVAGIEIQSTKNLTGRMASYLIDQLLEPNSTPWKLSDYGRDFLEATKAYAESIAEYQ